MYSFTIKDRDNQEIKGTYAQVSFFAKVKPEKIFSNQENKTSEYFRIEIIWDNSRKTTMNCSEDEYNKFSEGYDKYQKWLENNVSSVLVSHIQKNFKDIEKHRELVIEQMNKINEDFTKSVLDEEGSLIKEYSKKHELINKQTDKLAESIELIQSSFELLKEIMPEKKCLKNVDELLEIESYNQETNS